MSNVNIRQLKDPVSEDVFYPQTDIAGLVSGGGPGIDAVPTAGSGKLVQSSGVFNAIAEAGVVNISEVNKVGTTPAKYSSLSDAIAAVPVAYKKGGMSIKFIQLTPATYSVIKTEGVTEQPTGTEVQEALSVGTGSYTAEQLSGITLPSAVGNSVTYYLAVTVDEVTTYTTWLITYVQSSDNKYVQYRLKAQTFSTNEYDWENFNNVDYSLFKIDGENWAGNTSTGKGYYNQNGQIRAISQAGGNYKNVKLDCSNVINKEIGIYCYCGHDGDDVVKCLFVTEDNTVIEYWNHNGFEKKVVPSNAKYLLLSNLFDICSTPYVVGITTLNYLRGVTDILQEEVNTNLPKINPLAENALIYLKTQWLSGQIYTTNVRDGKNYFYDINGNLVETKLLQDKFGALKVDISSHIEKQILLKNKCGGSAYNLFVKQDNSVISAFQTNGTPQLIQVPNEAKYLLLSNEFKNIPYPIVALEYNFNEILDIQKRFFIDPGYTIIPNRVYVYTGESFPNNNYDAILFNVESYRGKIIKLISAAPDAAFNLFEDSDGNVISSWQTSFDAGNITEYFIVPQNASVLKACSARNIARLELRVLDESNLSQNFLDLRNFINNNLLNFGDYLEKREDISEFYLGTLYNNKQLVPTAQSGYTVTQINNPIPEVNIDKIPQYTKTGSVIFPFSYTGLPLGKKVGLWVNPSNYTTTFRVQCGVYTEGGTQRTYTGINIDLDSVEVGDSFSATASEMSIQVKCTTISSSGYVYLEVIVTSTNILDVSHTIIPYQTGGNTTGVSYQILLIEQGYDPYLKPVKIKVKDIIGNSKDTQYEKLCLPSKFIFEKGKTAMLFKRSMFKGINYKNYNIQIVVTDDTGTEAEEQKWCKDYDRYIQYTPTLVGEVNASIILYDQNRNVLDSTDVILKTVERTTQPDIMKTVLFIGDSLTYYNRISDEFYRVLTSNDAATTVQDTISVYNVKKPAGRGWGNIQLIGTQKNNYLGWVGQTYHEGMSGWQWQNFIRSGSPFYYNGVMDFAHYLTVNNFNTPDIVYIGLGWNDARSVVITNNGKDIDISAVMSNAKTFLDAITTQWPNTKVRLWTENITGIHGGVGNHPYGATVGNDEHRMNLTQFTIFEGYKELIQQYENVDLVWTTAFVDTEYCLQEETAQINTRISDTEVRGKDYVHPADSGFFQIADAIVADFCSLI